MVKLLVKWGLSAVALMFLAYLLPGIVVKSFGSALLAAAVIALLATAYDYLPAIRDYVPEGWVKWAALLIIAARVMNQRLPGDKQ